MSTSPRVKLRVSKAYLALAIALFAVEVVIALAFHDEFVRPILGDVLVVVLIYAAVRSVVDTRPLPTAVGVFLFACAVESAQYARLVDVLGLRHNAVARVVIGTAYDPRDLVAYAVGAVAIVLGERVLAARRERGGPPPTEASGA